ncbi:hypothetical protein BH10BAC3_BH10BAC3_18320 [soil metagenome]
MRPVSNDNIKALEQKNYEYIIGAQFKNESYKIKQQILQRQLGDAEVMKIKKAGNPRLIVVYANNRAYKDEHSRKRAYSGWKSK